MPPTLIRPNLPPRPTLQNQTPTPPNHLNPHGPNHIQPTRTRACGIGTSTTSAGDRGLITRTCCGGVCVGDGFGQVGGLSGEGEVLESGENYCRMSTAWRRALDHSERFS